MKTEMNVAPPPSQGTGHTLEAEWLHEHHFIMLSNGFAGC
jgi:hypothetical protein